MYYFGLLLIIILNIMPFGSRKLRFLISLIIPLIIIWIRFGHGADYFSYQFMYNRLDVSTFNNFIASETRFEIGFRLLAYPFLKLKIPFHVYFSLINTFTFALISLWIYDNSNNPILSLMLFYSMFYFVWILSAARQGLVLVVLLYTIFNQKINIKLKHKVLLLIFLSLFHLSSLFLLIVILLQEYKWGKKELLYFLIFSLLISFLPVGSIAEKMTFIPGVKQSLKYISNNFGFFDFPGVVRLIFFFLVWFHYDYITKENRFKRIVDANLLGFSLYFILKFSELTASRLTAYTFVLIVVIIPEIVKQYQRNKVLKIANTFILVGFSLVYLQKELTTLRTQAEDISTGTFVQMSTIFNPDYLQFGTNASFHIYQEMLSETLYNEFMDSHEKGIEVLKEYDDKDTYFVQSYKPRDEEGKLSGETYYGVMNQEGSWLLEPTLTRSPNLHKNVLVNVKWNNIFTNRTYIDLSQKDLSREEMLDIVLKDREEEYLFYEKDEVKLKGTVEDIPESLRKYYPNLNNIEYVRKSEIGVPFKYYVLQVKYVDKQSYIYLYESGEPIFDFVTKTPNRYLPSGILQTNTYYSPITIDSSGNIVFIN